MQHSNVMPLLGAIVGAVIAHAGHYLQAKIGTPRTPLARVALAVGEVAIEDALPVVTKAITKRNPEIASFLVPAIHNALATVLSGTETAGSAAEPLPPLPAAGSGAPAVVAS